MLRRLFEAVLIHMTVDILFVSDTNHISLSDLALKVILTIALEFLNWKILFLHICKEWKRIKELKLKIKKRMKLR